MTGGTVCVSRAEIQSYKDRIGILEGLVQGYEQAILIMQENLENAQSESMPIAPAVSIRAMQVALAARLPWLPPSTESRC